MTQRIVLASNNPGKLREIQAVVDPRLYQLIPQSELQISEVAETGTTFVENAIIKARHASRQSGLCALADDSGIEVDALQGAPGVRSARYAGEQSSDTLNNEKLLASLQGIPDHQRGARFHCVIVYLRYAGDPMPILCQGYLGRPDPARGRRIQWIRLRPPVLCADAWLLVRTTRPGRKKSHQPPCPGAEGTDAGSMLKGHSHLSAP